MRRLAYRYRRFFLDLLPILVAMAFAVAYFLTVVPNTRPYWDRYVLASVVLLLVDRIVITWYARAKLMPPIIVYKRGRKAGKAFSQMELEGFYRAFAGHVLHNQAMSAVGWIIAALTLGTVSYLWIQRYWFVFVGILFTGLIAATIALTMNYFFLQMQIRPLIEEVASKMETLPKVKGSRLGFRVKIGASVTIFAVVIFMAFGVMVYSRFMVALDAFALRTGDADSQAVAAKLAELPYPQWGGQLEAIRSHLFGMAVADTKGSILLRSPDWTQGEEPLREALSAMRGKALEGRVVTTGGALRFYPLPGDRFLVLGPNRQSLGSVVRDLSLAGGVFLVLSILCLAGYVTWLSRDTEGTLQRTKDANRRLAQGDLTQLPTIWSDDEIGDMADDLRSTIQSLLRMTREVNQASTSVDHEVSRTAGVVSSLHQRVAAQSQSADRTRQAIQAIEQKMLQVSQAMEQVASNTQEVSSAILQMQASVEEIARNSEVLTRSVETTVSSTNEIASTAEEIKGSTDNLHVAGQEAVSFLTELDASLEETRRNARQLSETSTRVTKDAEGGFSSVAAVEEQILRTHAASEQSRKALGDLTSAIEKIGRIVNVIQDVTEQTNLLSLNASIIAAGAGEYGKAFAVVATQIRELSARTASNTKEIRSIIGDLTASGSEMAAAMDKSFQVVESSTDLSRRAGESLRTILESASVQEEMSKRIAAATEELAHGGQSANRAMQEIFEMIEGISRAAREQASSTRYLTEESERVREVASQLGNATIEQAKGSRVISEAITRIMEDTAGTNAAVQDQTEEAKAVYEAMRAVATSAQAIEEAFRELTSAAGHLQQSAVTLKREIQIFRTT